MATSIRGRGAAYDIRPVEGRPGLFDHFFGGPVGGLIGAVKDACQGACAGLLGLLGASHMSASATPVATSSIAAGEGWASIPAILESMASGGLAGPIELLGGIVLFLAARRTISRTLGLLVFVGFVVALANGYELPEMLSALSDLLTKAAGALERVAAIAAGRSAS